ncbi:hypothetical protein A5772_02475 [Mycolicibacter sinensis]|uniref:Uncharacterized protein n=1 Tax=Mycolicibacter sinensis (strain JDM601) TaxID=875328 RepID=A0A1A2E9U4_MYCSD|nr:hypothetical protein A5771_15495 [Mycolicibacter sinensis]OBG05657.1 hypothetical protein A5772_02475 [Mycolicibacter sinensis]
MGRLATTDFRSPLETASREQARLSRMAAERPMTTPQSDKRALLIRKATPADRAAPAVKGPQSEQQAPIADRAAPAEKEATAVKEPSAEGKAA